MSDRPYIVYGAPLIEQDEIDEVVATLKSGWIGTGPKVALFEEEFRMYKKARYAIAVSSCTAALHLALRVLNLPEGSEVITTAMTFCATANAIIHAGCRPVLVDCEKGSMNISPAAIEKAITKNTRAIVPVHFAGYPCNMDAINMIAHKHNLIIVEDCAHAVETKYNGRHAGTWGEMGCFSFYVTKNVVTAEGGMIITDNEDYVAHLKMLALHGMSKDAWKRFSDDGYKHYEVIDSGYKYNMTDIQASLGIHQMAKIDRNYTRRKEIWDTYNRELAGLPLILPQKPGLDHKHAYHLYTVLVDIENTKITRDQLLMLLHNKGIGTGVHYIALNLHPFYQKEYGYKRGDFPNAEYISDRTLSLPLSPRLSNDDLAYVIESLKVIFL
ncbi:MAG: DegT/DnrJ/EryC1/StrS family aminotransferase [Candidatus Margulisiibacteriota bacterium]